MRNSYKLLYKQKIIKTRLLLLSLGTVGREFLLPLMLYCSPLNINIFKSKSCIFRMPTGFYERYPTINDSSVYLFPALT